jgi:hypothetical protein
MHTQRWHYVCPLAVFCVEEDLSAIKGLPEQASLLVFSTDIITPATLRSQTRKKRSTMKLNTMTACTGNEDCNMWTIS